MAIVLEKSTEELVNAPLADLVELYQSRGLSFDKQSSEQFVTILVAFAQDINVINNLLPPMIP